MSDDSDKPATKADVENAINSAIKDMRTFVLDRESSLIWKVIALQVTLIGAIAAANWAAFLLVMQHLVWKAS
jgi:hypothetical protein